ECATHLARALNDLGLSDDAQLLASHALEVRVRLCGAQSDAAADSLMTLAIITWARKDYAPAIEMATRALGIVARATGPGRLRAALYAQELSWMYMNRREFPAAKRYGDKYAALVKETCGADTPRYADSLGWTGVIQRASGDLAGAAETLRESLALSRV